MVSTGLVLLTVTGNRIDPSYSYLLFMNQAISDVRPNPPNLRLCTAFSGAVPRFKSPTAGPAESTREVFVFFGGICFFGSWE